MERQRSHSCSVNHSQLSRGIAMDAPRTFHLHMISDATGETLVAIAKAVRVQYSQVRAIEHIHPLVRSKRELERVLQGCRSQSGHGALHHRQSGACRASRADLQEAERSLRAGAEKHPASVRNPISAPRRRRRSPASTCSTPIISGASTLSTSPCCMTTAICRRISTMPIFSSSASAAPRRRRPASISPIAATRPPTCR